MSLRSSKSSGGHRLVTLGAGGVGKSAIVVRMVANEFRQQYDATIEDSYTCTINVDGQNALLDILDTAGQEQFKALRNHWIREAEAFVLVYAVNNMASFKNADELYKAICRAKDDLRIDLVLVGNKIDLAESQHVVTYEMGKALADSWGSPFIETSAKTGANVNEAFELLVRELRRSKSAAALDDIPKVKEYRQSSGCCCTIM